MTIITAYATQNPCYREGKLLIPQGIVVHSTGANNPYLKRYVDAPAAVGKNTYGNHWNTPNTKVCVHSFIGYTDEKKVAVANILPYDMRCWGVGSGSKGSFNKTHIQFEICEDGLTDPHYFKKVWDIAVEYCRYLCDKFGIDTENIVGHYEAHKLGYGSNHADPSHWFAKHGKTMDDFRNAVAGSVTDSAKVDDVYTQLEFVKDIQKAIGAKVDGIAGNETLSKTPTVSWKKNNRHAVVKPIQKRLYALGYTEVGKADGIAGAKFQSAIAHYQDDIGLKKPDGELTAGNFTWKKILGM